MVAVVAGLCYSFSYRRLCLAAIYLVDNNATFIATNEDNFFRTKVKDRRMPAGGSIIKAIQSGTDIDPILMGKPTPRLFEILRKEHGLEHEELSKFIMIGDTLKTDILFGNNSGIDSLVVLTGNTTLSELEHIFSNLNELKDVGTPTYVTQYFGYTQYQ